MKRLISKITKSTLVKTSFLNGIANFIKILASLLSSKVTAIYLGPAGVALLGQFMNVTSMGMSFSTLGINSGITKYTAEHFDNPKGQSELISTGFMMTLVGSVLVSLGIILGREYLSNKLLHTGQYASAFGILGATIILFALNSFLMSILNGFKEFKKIAVINMASSVVSLCIAIVLVIKFGVYGAFLGVVLSQTLIFFVTFLFVVKSTWFKPEEFLSGFELSSLKKLLHYSLMAFTTIFAVTFVQLQIRNYLIQSLSIEQAGYWQGITRISDLYLTFITMTLSIYYLPRLSELKKKEDLRKEIIKAYIFILPMAIGSALTIFILRGWIIKVLLAKSFLPMLPLFLMQLIGDVFKIASWILGYLMLAKGMTKVFIITEFFFGIFLYIFTRIFVKQMGLVGTTYAFALNYFIYLFVMIFIFRDILFLRVEPKSLSNFGKGLKSG